MTAIRRGRQGGFRKIVGGLLGPLVLLGVLPAPATAYPRPGLTERVSLGADGAEGDRDSYHPSVSADGRFIAFATVDSTLVPGDDNERADVFVRDRVNGTTERVSLGTGGTQADLQSFSPSISADGRHVAFHSFASNLVPGDTNENWDVFVHDRNHGTTERVSVASDGAQGERESLYPSISADGRSVAFQSQASTLVPGDGIGQDIFAHDRETGTTELISTDPDGHTQASGYASYYPSISADGRYVAFRSASPFLAPSDGNSELDIFVRDRETETTHHVSVASDGQQANTHSHLPSISGDGRYVAFYSSASNLVPGDTNGALDVFVHDLETGDTERVSVAGDGQQGNEISRGGSLLAPSISADGRYVAFFSGASNLVPEDTKPRGNYDVFVRDRETQTTERVSVGADGAEGNSHSAGSSISADGRYVAFDSSASNLVPGDANELQDVFVRDRGPSTGVVDLSAVPSGDGISVSGSATLTGAVLASSADPPGDGVPGAEPAGAELTRASLVYRPEDGDLLVQVSVASLPALAAGPACFSLFVNACAGRTNAGGGAPDVLYGLGFDLGGTRYEIRALRSVTTVDPVAAHLFGLYRCEPDCTERARLSGGIGTTGSEVLVSVPLSALDAEEGTELSAIGAFAALGEATPGAVATLDEIALPDTTIPAREVSLGVAPAGTPEANVRFDVPAALTDGAFSGTLDGSSLSSGDSEVWARACLGETCAAAKTSIRAPGPTPTPTPSPDAETVAYYFHSASGSNNLDQLEGSAAFDRTSPTAADPANAIDVPGVQNAEDDGADPTWYGELSKPASSLTVDFWARTLPAQATGFVAYTVRVSTGGEYFELVAPIWDAVPAGSTGFTRMTHTFNQMAVPSEYYPGEVDWVPLELPAGPFTITVQGSSASTEIRFDSVDFPSGFTTSGGSEPGSFP